MKNSSFSDGIHITYSHSVTVSLSNAVLPAASFQNQPALAFPERTQDPVNPKVFLQRGINPCCTLRLDTLQSRHPANKAAVELSVDLAYGEDSVIFQMGDGLALWTPPATYLPFDGSDPSERSCLRRAIFRIVADAAGSATRELTLFIFRFSKPDLRTSKSATRHVSSKPRGSTTNRSNDDTLGNVGKRSVPWEEVDIDSSRRDAGFLSDKSTGMGYIEQNSAFRGIFSSIDSAADTAEAPPMEDAAPLPPPLPPPASQQPQTVTAYVRAEMDDEVVLNHASTLTVAISREELESLESSVSQSGSGEFRTGRKMLVELIVRSNFLLLGDETGCREIDIPEAGSTAELFFNLKACEPGESSILVIARQDQVPIVKLELKPVVVASKTHTPKKASAAGHTEEPRPLQKPLHQFWIREIRNEQGISYEYRINSHELRIQEFSATDPFKGDRAAYVNNLYAIIEEKWAANKRDRQNFLQELRAFGADLFDQLIPLSLQKVLWKYRKQFNGIQVISTEPFIPWELVHLKNPAKKGMPKEECFLGQLGITRWLMGAGTNGWPTESITVRQKRAHYVIPDYDSTSLKLPEAAEEALFLDEHFHAQPVSPELHVVRNLVSTPGSFDLLHFACHGEADPDNIGHSVLLLNGRMVEGSYEPERFSETVAARFSDFEAPDGNRPLITVNACQTGRAGYKLTGIGGFANAFLNAGAGAFIGALWSVGDAPARTFTETLYTVLLKGCDLSEAIIEARKASRKAGDATWLAYVAYGHPHLVLKT